jgi:hypothetical protein
MHGRGLPDEEDLADKFTSASEEAEWSPLLPICFEMGKVGIVGIVVAFFAAPSLAELLP